MVLVDCVSQLEATCNLAAGHVELCQSNREIQEEFALFTFAPESSVEPQTLQLASANQTTSSSYKQTSYEFD